MVLFTEGGSGLVAWEVLAMALVFEAVFRVSGLLLKHLVKRPGFALDPKRHERLATDGPSYMVSMVHAAIVVMRGVTHLRAQRGAPPEALFRQPTAGPYAAAANAIEPTNIIFLAFLCDDLCHVLSRYPRLGGADVLAHHGLFVYASVVCGSNRMFPWPFAWLILGECSTVPLNLRWFWVQTGRGATRAMSATNWAFAVTFFLCRIVLFGYGLAHMAEHRGLVAGLVRECPPLGGVVLLLAAGYGLNVVWFKQIVDVALGRGRHARKVKDA